MSNRFDLLAEQILHKPIVDCSVDELETLVHDYPYFAPAQFLLTKKLEETKSLRFQAQLQKAVLYYHEPPQFHIFLNEDIGEAEFYVNDDVEINEAEKNEEEGTASPLESQDALHSPAEALVNHDADLNTSNVEETDAQFIIENNRGNGIEESSSPAENNLITAEPATENTLPFEPYHTIDYFASQGIKLSQDEASKDRLGKQLKSFTEWLKTMKRLPSKEQAKIADPVSEQKVENLAAHSVEGGEVVTETMAEVWEKQGNKEKAIETYHKLSLLNPSKRAYFAAKIDVLKKEN